MLYNFCFVIDGVLAGSAQPGTMGSVMEDLEDARLHGITHVVSLTESPLPRAAISESGLGYDHIPVEDFTPPSLKDIERFTEIVDEVRKQGGAVLVHCRAGVGRTGTMLAAYLVHKGMTASEAIERVRELRPGSVETRSQEKMVRKYEKHARKKG